MRGNKKCSLVVAAAVNEHVRSFDLGQIISLFGHEPICPIADEAFLFGLCSSVFGTHALGSSRFRSDLCDVRILLGRLCAEKNTCRDD